VIPWNLPHWQRRHQTNAEPHMAKGNIIHESFPMDSHVPKRSWHPLPVMLSPGLNIFPSSHGTPSAFSRACPQTIDCHNSEQNGFPPQPPTECGFRTTALRRGRLVQLNPRTKHPTNHYPPQTLAGSDTTGQGNGGSHLHLPTLGWIEPAHTNGYATMPLDP